MYDLHARSFAVLAVRTGDRRAARKARAGARRLSRSKHPMSKARAEVIKAALHTIAGELERARACWQAALPQFEACGMRAHQAALCLRLGEPARAADYCAAEGIREPERLLQLLAPAR
jgi:hypothetical protein